MNAAPENQWLARMSCGFIELNTGTSFVYDISVKDFRERRTEWLRHLRQKNWFTAAHEAEIDRLVKENEP